MTIAAVERDTGISKDTLRVWERRYGFPSPERDQFGERVYSLEQVDKLRLIRRLLDVGHRPGRIVRYPVAQLHQLAGHTSHTVNAQAGPDQGLERFLDLVRTNQIAILHQQLSQTSLRLGVEKFVTEVAAPLTVLVGDAWARGQLRIYEEHLLTESIRVVMRNAISSIPRLQSGRPRVLLTTFPNEPHGVGLLMVEALMTLEGCRCYSLGTETPVTEILAASAGLEVDIVALSFTGAPNPTLVSEGVNQLRAELPEPVQLWVGGRCPTLARRPPSDIELITDLTEIRPALARWHQAHDA